MGTISIFSEIIQIVIFFFFNENFNFIAEKKKKERYIAWAKIHVHTCLLEVKHSKLNAKYTLCILT